MFEDRDARAFEVFQTSELSLSRLATLRFRASVAPTVTSSRSFFAFEAIRDEHATRHALGVDLTELLAR